MLRIIALGTIGISIILSGSSQNYEAAPSSDAELIRARDVENRQSPVQEKPVRRQSETEEKRQVLPQEINPLIEPTRAGGSRGCQQARSVALTLLAPAEETALTSLGHPTFYWHISEQVELPMVFTLVESGGDKAILEKTISQPQPGVIGFTLPDNIEELEVGKEYQWSVSLVCNYQRPSANIVGRAWIRRVNFSPELKQALATITSPQERGQALAQAGIWYDALAYLMR